MSTHEQFSTPPLPANTNREMRDRNNYEETYDLYFISEQISEKFINYIINHLPDTDLDRGALEYFHQSLRSAIPHNSYINVQIENGMQYFDPPFIDMVRSELQMSMDAMRNANQNAGYANELDEMNRYIHAIVQTLENGIPNNVIPLR